MQFIFWLIKFSFLLGLVQYPVEYTLPRHKKVFQGQENRNTGAQQLGAQTPEVLPHLVPPSNPDWGRRQLGLENQVCIPMHGRFYQCSSNKRSYFGGNIAAPYPTHQWPPMFDNVSVSRNISVSNVTSSNSGYQECRASESRDENEPLLAQPTGCNRYMLFGVNLFNSYPELPSPQVATYCELLSPCSFPPTSQSSVSHTIQVSSEPSKSSSGVLEKQCKRCSVTNRSCTKVIFFNCFYNLRGKRILIELHLLNLHNKSSDCGLATSHSSRFLHL